MELGDKIHQLRIQKQLTLEQVGNFVGVGKSTVRKWENGMIENMRRDKIAKLAQILGVTPSYLMDWENITYNGIIGDNNSNNVLKIEKEQLGEVESELLTICKKLNMQKKIKLLSFAYELEKTD